MSLLVISGISGAGKTQAATTLEDIGYNVVDNLPPSLLLAVSKLNEANNVAVIIDSRSKDKYDTLLEECNKLKQAGIEYQLVFLDCEQDVILGRYKETRRTHPLTSKKYPTLESAIEHEYQLSKEIKDAADIVIDTTKIDSHQLKKLIKDTFKLEDYQGITIKLISFGFKNGLPSEADLVYDVRCMPNPFYINELKPLSGNDQEVVDYIFGFEQSTRLLNMMNDFIHFSLPYYIEEGKNELVIGIGCTSGHHRSVAFVNKIRPLLEDLGYNIVVIHRDIDKRF